MPIFNEEDENRLAFGSVTGALGSNAAIDLDGDARQGDLLAEVANKNLDLARALLQTHPDYDEERDKWQKYLDLYQSNDVYRFIHRHLRESDPSWKKRVERGYFYNYVASVVDLFTAFLFHSPIDREVAEDDASLFEEIYKDADKRGTMFQTLMKDVCTFAQVEGHVGILVDAPRLPEGGIASEQERKDSGLRPFLVLVHARQIRDWEVDEFGNFNWVKLEVARPRDRDWREAAARKSRHFTIWTKTEFTEYELLMDEQGEPEIARITSGGTHGLGKVPLVIARVIRKADHSWFGLSVVRDIADINIAILNWASMGDEEIFERCLNVLTMERSENDATVQLSHHNILEYEPGATPPKYLEPGPTALSNIKDWMKEGRDEIRRLAKLNISTGLGDVRQSSSGIAQAFQFLETNQTLADKAKSLEQVETDIHQLVALWLSSDFDGTINYPKDFGVEDLLVMFQEMGLARSNLTSETAIKELEKKLARKLFSKDPMELRKKIEEEIDAAEEAVFGMSMLGMLPPADGDAPAPQEEELKGDVSAEDVEQPTVRQSQDSSSN